MTIQPFFPSPEKDELFYSLIARYHREAGRPSWSSVLECLFGRRHVVASHDLPSDLGAFCSRLPTDNPLHDPVHLVETVTLLPYYVAGASEPIATKVLQQAINGGSSGHLSLGLAASRVPRVAALRFCPMCNDEALQERGFIWWRRRHQLPGTLVCVQHGCELKESPRVLRDLGRHEFLLADAGSCPAQARSLADPRNAAAMGVLTDLARVEAAILCGETSLAVGEVPLAQLASVGLMRSTRRVNQASACDRVNAFLAPALPYLPEALSPAEVARWLPPLLRRPRKAAHPLFHAVLQSFIASQPEQHGKVTQPFGAGPWTCRNPLADHHGKPVVDKLSTYRSKGATVGRFQCSCGYIYTQGLSPEGVLSPIRYVDFGPMLEPRIRALVEAGASLRSTARELGLDPKTVVAEARRLGVEVPWMSSVGERRAPAFLKPLVSRATRTRRAIQPAARRDWNSIDDATLARLRDAAASIMAATPPERVTIASLDRLLGKRGWLRRNRQRLPRAMEFVRGAVESTASYRRRRAIHVIRASSETPVPWQIMRAAGLTGRDLPMIREEINKLAEPA